MPSFSFRNRIIHSGVGLSLAIAIGCDSKVATSTTQPESPPSSRPLEGLEKDLKPPVIIKPNVTPPGDANQTAPQRSPR